jgi:hypothetical protein
MIILPHRRKAFRGGGAFDPTSITGCQLWLDASDSTTLFDATSGGSLPTDGGNVKRWEDKSGNARHATESTYPPIRKTAILNGLDAIRWNGTTSVIKSTLTNLSQPYTIFSVTKWDGTIPGDGYRFFYDSQGSSGRALLGVNLSDYYIDSGTQVMVDQPDTNTNAYAVCYNAGSSTFHVNGNPITMSSPGTKSSGTEFWIGHWWGGDNFTFKGDFGEILIYNSALGTSDREAVESYLMTKWGI